MRWLRGSHWLANGRADDSLQDSLITNCRTHSYLAVTNCAPLGTRAHHPLRLRLLRAADDYARGASNRKLEAARFLVSQKIPIRKVCARTHCAHCTHCTHCAHCTHALTARTHCTHSLTAQLVPIR